LARYRYRTPALAGPWRDSPEAAAKDAVFANQAQDDPNEPLGMRWLVPGEIEVEADGPRLRAAKGR
jgi:hypothetical protein